MKRFRTTTLIALSLFSVFLLKAADSDDSLKVVNWQNLDPNEDKFWGVRTEKAYQDLLHGKTSTPVIVAVIDGGVDIEHEELKDFIWKNEDEIPDNGIDDDNNGYIDDIHGWNFLGNKDGEYIDEATLEVTRLYRKFSEIAGDKSEGELKNLDGFDYDYYKKVKNEYTSKTKEYSFMKASYLGFKKVYLKNDSLVASAIGKKDYTDKELKALKVEKNTAIDSAQKFLIKIKKAGFKISDLDEALKHVSSRLDYHFNTEHNARSIVGDDVSVWDDASYGNNNVSAATPTHGTMCSSLIGANRNNNIGIKGVADNVIIMPIRTVPDGDEWDKDVAKSIEYAIKNGAQIVNMSFGKSFSPEKEFIDKVIKLADEHDVLLIHASGNDSKNIDFEDNFPNNFSDNKKEKPIINNWITVGATAKARKKKEFVARFSNYGSNVVDIFAPGHEILAATPGNKYESASGTSFAAPMVSGAAALIKSYYPEFSASEIKSILLESSNKKDSKVLVPGTGGKYKKIVPFSTLSDSGGILDVYSALQLAEKRSKTKQN
jgi:subtilisin family serine protease